VIDEILRQADFADVGEMLHNDGIELRANVLSNQWDDREEKTELKNKRSEAFHRDHLYCREAFFHFSADL
jgi:hypothetical protein